MSVKCVIRQSGGLKTSKEKLYPEVVNASTITEEEFAEMVCRNRSLQPAHVKAVLTGVWETAGELLSLGHRVRIDGLGSLSLSMKGALRRDNRGVIQLKDASVRTVRILPSRKLVDRASRCNFALVSHDVIKRASADMETATTVARTLLSDKTFFVCSDFRERAAMSRTLARKMLDAMEEKGLLKKQRSGQLYIWSKGDEFDSSSPAGE